MIAMNRSGGFQNTVPKIFWHAAVVVNPIRDTSVPVRNKHEIVPMRYPDLFLAYREKSEPFVIPAAWLPMDELMPAMINHEIDHGDWLVFSPV